MSLDPRGTRSPRGREWRKVIYGKIGIVATHDHAAGMKEVLRKYPFMDPERVGIWGWSGGGQMTLNCMFHYPEIYKTGIAVAFVSDQRYIIRYTRKGIWDCHLKMSTDSGKAHPCTMPINLKVTC